MVETFKVIVGMRFKEWMDEIKKAPERSKVIDISKEFMEIVARNILVTILGEDINDEKIEL